MAMVNMTPVTTVKPTSVTTAKAMPVETVKVMSMTGGTEEPAQRPVDERQFLRQKDLAKRLGFHPRTVKRMEAAGELPPSLKKNKHRLYPRFGPTGVEAWEKLGMPNQKTLLAMVKANKS